MNMRRDEIGQECLFSKRHACQLHVSLLVVLLLFGAKALNAQDRPSLLSISTSTDRCLFTLHQEPASSNLLPLSLEPPSLQRASYEESPRRTDGALPWKGDEILSAQFAEVPDSFPHPPARRLLPANISFMEKGLWGENGFLREAGIAAPLTPEVRQSELGLRRTMLTLHQIGGFTSLGLMITTAYFGQRSLDNNSSRSLRSNHQTFVAATIVSYSATGLLVILSPPPLIRRDEVSTTTIHKTLAWVHAAGMIITPILGSMIGRQRDSQRAHIHQIAGYVTTATFAASMITVTF